MTLVELAKKNTKIIGITPAMPTGSSMKYMIEKFPERAFDVGIAEQHAVTFAAGLATQGFTPFCAIYSTFLQRSYDQVIHDVALQKLLLENIIIVAKGGKSLAEVPSESVDYFRKLKFISTVASYSSCLLYTSPSPRDLSTSRMPSSA